MELSSGDLVKADGETWRVDRILDEGVHTKNICLISLSGSVQHWVTKDRIDANLTFNQRLIDGDLSALVQLTEEERRSFEARSWQMFFARHVKYTDCQSARQLLENEFHGEPISLRGLEEVAQRIDSSLPKRKL